MVAKTAEKEMAMDNVNTENLIPPGAPDPGEVLIVRLNRGQHDRQALEQLIAQSVKDLFTENLRVVEEILKHKPGDPDEKRQLFEAYRSRILNAGNSTLRKLPMILRAFLVEQVYDTRIVTKQTPREDGPWALPRGVKHPSVRQ